MISIKQSSILKFLSLFTSIIICSCSSLNFFEDNKFYYKNGYQRVQLHSENDNVRNIHPVKIDPLRVEGALKLILTKYGPKAESLFQDNKILAYSIAISEALEEAKPNQDVVFTLEGWYKAKTLSNNLVTGGRIFYNKKGLNLIFGSIMRKGNLSETDPMLSHGVNPDLQKNPYAPGSRYQSIKSSYTLTTIPNSGVFRPKEAKGRIDWLVFTPKALKARSDLTFDQKKFSTASNFQVQGLRNELNTLKSELRNIRQNQYNNLNPGYGNYMPRQQYNMPPPPPPPYGYYPNQYYNYPIQQNSQVNQQVPKNNRQISLKSLESMRQRGLISEETYIKKVQELGY
jgi:hypothetical protein